MYTKTFTHIPSSEVTPQGFFAFKAQDTQRDTSRPAHYDLPGGAFSAIECTRPLRDKTGEMHPCKTTDVFRCPSCAERWRENVRNQLIVALTEAHSSAMLTLTYMRPTGTTSPSEVHTWNQKAPVVRRNLTRRVRRWLMNRGYVLNSLRWVVEFQLDGTAHFHMVLDVHGENTLTPELWAQLAAHLNRNPTRARTHGAHRVAGRVHIAPIVNPQSDGERVANYLTKALLTPDIKVNPSRRMSILHIMGERLGSHVLLGYSGHLQGGSRPVLE
ncbi:rolling circle replication-associated protein [Rothia terrae]|uniref:rolling circle replication-associated protein n=1 Tax=Rothia terrae TaxID=396015 RepID=UPI0028816A37|nr:hypothetical protein [Rothia terrae]MDT0189105.1 hypothetical protein [Rothia terrae]